MPPAFEINAKLTTHSFPVRPTQANYQIFISIPEFVERSIVGDVVD